MSDTWLIPFQYDYMLKAMWVSALIGGSCGVLSAFVTLRGWSLMGDALSHAVVPGVAIAYLVGIPFAAGAFIAGLLAAGAMGFVSARTRVRQDAVIGVVFTAFFAFGVLLISVFPSPVDLKTIVLGNILAISNRDALQVAAMAVIGIAVVVVKWRDLALFCFDPNQARALGIRTGWLHTLLLVLLSAMAVAALQAVGAALVMATLVIPGATAYLLVDRFGRLIIVSGILGTVTAAAGAYASYFVDGATGGCIVSLQAAVFLIVFLFAPKHGLLAARLRRSEAAEPAGVIP